MVPHFNDDHVVMGLQAGTHWDALGHVSYNRLALQRLFLLTP